MYSSSIYLKYQVTVNTTHDNFELEVSQVTHILVLNVKLEVIPLTHVGSENQFKQIYKPAQLTTHYLC